MFLSGSVDFLYVEPEDSNNNLTSHFLELLSDIIIQDNRKAPHILHPCPIHPHCNDPLKANSVRSIRTDRQVLLRSVE